MTKSELNLDWGHLNKVSALAAASDDDTFVLPPLPNTLFTRDSSCWIYDGVSINPMYWPARRLEAINVAAIYRAHPMFAGANFNFWYPPMGNDERFDISDFGRAALEGRVDPGWMTAWILILLTLVPLRSAVTWLQGVVSTRAGGALKQRLLAGALRLDPEEVRHRGTGELLGKVLESEALESLALGGGFLLLQGGLEVVVAAVVLANGSGGWIHVGLLVVWLVITAGLGGGGFEGAGAGGTEMRSPASAEITQSTRVNNRCARSSRGW